MVKSSDFVEKAFWLLLSGSVAYFAYGVRDEMRNMNQSLSALNVKMAAVVTTLSSQDKTVSDHESRIRKLEEE